MILLGCARAADNARQGAIAAIHVLTIHACPHNASLLQINYVSKAALKVKDVRFKVSAERATTAFATYATLWVRAPRVLQAVRYPERAPATVKACFNVPDLVPSVLLVVVHV